MQQSDTRAGPAAGGDLASSSASPLLPFTRSAAAHRMEYDRDEYGDLPVKSVLCSPPAYFADLSVRSQYSWQLSQSIWNPTDWRPILSAVGISTCCPVVPACGLAGPPTRKWSSIASITNTQIDARRPIAGTSSDRRPA